VFLHVLNSALIESLPSLNMLMFVGCCLGAEYRPMYILCALRHYILCALWARTGPVSLKFVSKPRL
jgi:hypothetical protein